MAEFSDNPVITYAKTHGAIPDVSSLLSQDAALMPGMNGPAGWAPRIAVTTVEGIADTPRGLYNAAVYDIHHPMEIVKTVAGSAAIAAGLKIILPEAGPVGRVAGLALGAWFVASSAPGFINAYKTGLNAEKWSELHESGQQWGNAAGQLGVNSALGWVGYKVGAGVSGNILARESFDKFADFKQNIWDGATDGAKRLFAMDTSIPTASSVGLRPNYQLEGDHAKLVDSAQAAPSDKVIGPSDANADMSATIMLKSKASLLRMDRYIARMAEGSAKALGDEGNAFQERFGASQESLDALNKFAQQNNLTVAESDLRSGRVLLNGKTADFQKAFGVELKNYQTTDGTVKGHSGAVTVPTELAPHVRAVLGVDARPVAVSNYRLQRLENDGSTAAITDTNTSNGSQPAAPPDTSPGSDLAPISPQPGSQPTKAQVDFLKDGGYLATEIARAQNIPLRTGGAGQHGAFVSMEGGIDLPDYNRFFPEHNLEQPNPLGILEVDGAKNSPGDPIKGDTENALDGLQMQSVAPKAKIDMILGPNNNKGMVDVFERGIFPKNGEAQKTVISSSWGLAEQKQTSQAVNTMSMLFRQGVIRGVQIVAGAGDAGAKSNSPTFQPEFPASDPNVTGVGGLKMILDAKGKIASAFGWDEGEPSSGGGGVSKIFKLPWWQQNSNVPNNPDNNRVGRGVPDISTNAAKKTGFPVRVGGENLVIGGTSAGAPLYAGMLLNLNAELAEVGIRPITPLNPWMYARANTDIFHEVTVGSNHGFTAGKGWNPVAGLGWVDGAAMLDAMKVNQTTSPMGRLGWMTALWPNGINFTASDPQQQP